MDIIKSLQFAWFVGHALTIVNAALHFFAISLFFSGRVFYVLAYLGSIAAYGIVIYKAYGVPRKASDYAYQLLVDENAYYLFMALYWMIYRPVSVTLIPYAVYALFHVLHYIETVVIPKLGQGGPAWASKAQHILKTSAANYYPKAMQLVAQFEVIGIMGRLLLGAILFRFTPIILYAHFLRFRYCSSSYSRKAWHDVRMKLDTLLDPPAPATARVPPVGTKAYRVIKEIISRFGVSLSAPQNEHESISSQDKRK